jgi:hypothetical protein
MTDPSQLPNGIVTGMAVNSDRATTADGSEHAVVYVSFQFHVGSGDFTANQTFIMHALDAKELRAMLKNPKAITTIQAEEAQQ